MLTTVIWRRESLFDNIRPLVTAGVLRKKFTIHWNKDRGRDPDGGERINDRHVARAAKVAARAG